MNARAATALQLGLINCHDCHLLIEATRGDAVDLSLHFGDHERRGLGGAGRRRDHREGRGAGAPEVLVREVEDVLVVGVGVDGHHRRVLEAERVADGLHHRHEAVGGA